MLDEFKTFVMRGNVMDMAIGIILGVAFGKIVSSIVADVIMPPIGLMLGGVDFSELAIVLREETTEAAAVTINYGLFINTVVDFIIIAFVLFIAIKQVNKLKKTEPKAAPTTKKCSHCYSEIALEASRCPHCTSEV